METEFDPEIPETTPISELSPAQIDFLSLGLAHNFSAELDLAIGKDVTTYWLVFLTDNGEVRLHKSADSTVGEIWKAAQAIAEFSERGELPLIPEYK